MVKKLQTRCEVVGFNPTTRRKMTFHPCILIPVIIWLGTKAIFVPAPNLKAPRANTSTGWCFGSVLKWLGHLLPADDTDWY